MLGMHTNQFHNNPSCKGLGDKQYMFQPNTLNH